MKNIKIIAFGVFIVVILNSLDAQNNKLSIDLNVPIQPFGDNFIRQNYDGIIDMGLKYNFLNVSKIDFGISSDIALFDMVDASMFDTRTKLIMFRPRISGEIKISKLNPYAGIGYSLLYFNVVDKPDDFDNTSDGLNFNVGLKFHIMSKLYLNLGYDFIKIRTEGNIINNSYNRNIQILDLGFGLQL